jgi:hypothetical protein
MLRIEAARLINNGGIVLLRMFGELLNCFGWDLFRLLWSNL